MCSAVARTVGVLANFPCEGYNFIDVDSFNKLPEKLHEQLLSVFYKRYPKPGGLQ